MDNNSGSFLKGLLFGAAVGAVAGVLLAPKSGKETRDDLSKLMDKMKNEATDKFEEARSLVMEQVANLKIAGRKIDQQKYFDIVNEVVAKVSDDKELAVEASKKLVSQLKRDWNKVQKVFTTKPEVSGNNLTK